MSAEPEHFGDQADATMAELPPAKAGGDARGGLMVALLALGIPTGIGMALNVIISTARGETRWAVLVVILGLLALVAEWRAKRKSR